MSLLLVAVSVEGAEPVINITSPDNATYSRISIALNVSYNETPDWCVYSLNGAANDTSICPAPITTFNDSSTKKNLSWANETITDPDASGSKLVYFTIPKNISVITKAELNMTGYRVDAADTNITFDLPAEITDITGMWVENNGTDFYTGNWGQDGNIYSFNSAGLIATYDVSTECELTWGVWCNDTNCWVTCTNSTAVSWVAGFDRSFNYQSKWYLMPPSNYLFPSGISSPDNGEHFLIIDRRYPTTRTRLGRFNSTFDLLDNCKIYDSADNYFTDVHAYGAYAWVATYDRPIQRFLLSDIENCDTGETEIYPDNTFLNRLLGGVPSGNCFASGITGNATDIWCGSALYDYQYQFVKKYPENITIDMGNDGDIEWRQWGDFSITNSTNNLSSEMNDYLSTCSPDANGNCLVPLNISSDSIGILELFGMEIKYTQNVSITAQEGSNTLYVHANNSGDMGSSYVVFTMDPTPSLLMECSDVVGWPEALTFHMLAEENRSAMDATMEITLWLSNGTYSDESSFKFENSDTYHICIFPTYAEYQVNATIEYYGTSHTRRNYFLSNATINNVTSDINLYLLDSASATNIQFLAKDVYHNLQENVIIKAQRFYTSENEYITVAMGRTGFDGVAGIPLRQNIWYRYILERDNAVLRTYNPMYLTESELELYIEQAERIEFFMYWGTVAHSCSYNNDTQNLLCTFSDTSGKMVEVKLMAEERRPVGNYVTVCENTTVSTSGTLACSLAAHQNKTINYYMYGRFCCSEQTYMVMESGILDLNDAFSYGMIGVLVTFVLVLSAGMTGIWNPAVSIVLTMVALFASITMQLITVGPAAFMGLVAVAGLIVFKMRS